MKLVNLVFIFFVTLTALFVAVKYGTPVLLAAMEVDAGPTRLVCGADEGDESGNLPTVGWEIINEDGSVDFFGRDYEFSSGTTPKVGVVRERFVAPDWVPPTK